MATNEARLEALEDAIATGARSIKYDGREITYNSLADMIAVRDMLKAKLGQQTSRTTYGQYER